MNNKIKAIIFALLAAVFYAVNVPLSKIILRNIEPSFMAGILYLGAGLGMLILQCLNLNGEKNSEPFTKDDFPFVAGMIVLDIIAPIFLMTGITYGTSSNASLLGNFEIVATALIASVIFREPVSKRLRVAIALITLSGMILTFEEAGSLEFSRGSIFVLAAATFWGLENNCTRKLSSKSAGMIVILKGFFSGIGSICIALMTGENIPPLKDSVYALLLGFVAYGLSIFFYVRAQETLGAAKTSAYYAAAPFIGALLSFVMLRENLSGSYLVALVVMLAGSMIVVIDTLRQRHTHVHRHAFIHTHNGITHAHIFTHSHGHNHYIRPNIHSHIHGKNTHNP